MSSTCVTGEKMHRRQMKKMRTALSRLTGLCRLNMRRRCRLSMVSECASRATDGDTDQQFLRPSRPMSSAPPSVNPLVQAFRLIRYYKYNIFVPGILGFVVWADYSHTSEWKAKQKALQAAEPKGNI